MKLCNQKQTHLAPSVSYCCGSAASMPWATYFHASKIQYNVHANFMQYLNQMPSQHSTSLLDLFSSHLISTQLAPYVPTSTLFNLLSTSRRFNEVIRCNPSAFRRLDLSNVRGLPIRSTCELESVGEHAAMDSYCLALTNIDTTLWKRDILPTVQTLILDRQYIHIEDIRNILLDNGCQVRLISLLNVEGFDAVDLKDLFQDIYSGGPGLSPRRLEGVYFFGPPVVSRKFCDQIENAASKSTSRDRTAGAETQSEEYDGPNPWYLRSKTAFQPPGIETSCSSVLRATKGILAWDAVLCRAPRHTYPHPKYTAPPIASVALGQNGCHICHSAPEGPASAIEQRPLLAPLPFHSSSVKSAQQIPSDGAPVGSLPFYARCVYCLKHRWCAMCNKWWCENCYQFGGPNCYKENNARGPDSAGSKVMLFLFADWCLRDLQLIALSFPPFVGYLLTSRLQVECDQCGRLVSKYIIKILRRVLIAFSAMIAIQRTKNFTRAAIPVTVWSTISSCIRWDLMRYYHHLQLFSTH